MFSSKPKDNERSKSWPKVRKAYLKKHPVCEICGCKKGLNIHHKLPFHLHPDLELLESNFITLCEHLEHSCHFIFGHLFNFHSYNKDIEKDALKWNTKIINRPN